MVTKNIKLKNADGDYLYPYTENLPTASTSAKGAVKLDSTPTSGSNNALTSGGAKTALDNKLDKTATAEKATADASGNTITTTYATKTELSAVEKLANSTKNIAEGRVSATVVENYSELVTELKSAAKDDYKIGDNFYIQALNVPDLWICDVKETSTSYIYSNDAAITSALKSNGIIQIGYFELAQLETEKIDLSGYVPTFRTINGKALTGNITLSASDVGALASGATASKATSDANGNNIATTYATKAEIITFEEM